MPSTAAATSHAPLYPPVRRITFPFQAANSSGRYFADGNIVMSHILASMSGSFPMGEEGFIRSVRAYADQITDPVLKKRVAGFIGQEAVHGQQHRGLNQRLIELGYPIAWVDAPKHIERVKKMEKLIGTRMHLASTAAAEHFTAVFAAQILGSEEIQAIPGELEVWNLLNWHAFEELEHKSVAFDVFKATGGTEFARIGTVVAMGITATPILAATILTGFALDPYARSHPARLVQETWSLLRGPFLKGLTPEILKYLRPGFHPDDIDTQALLERWQAELFGTDGALVENLK